MPHLCCTTKGGQQCRPAAAGCGVSRCRSYCPGLEVLQDCNLLTAWVSVATSDETAASASSEVVMNIACHAPSTLLCVSMAPGSPKNMPQQALQLSTHRHSVTERYRLVNFGYAQEQACGGTCSMGQVAISAFAAPCAATTELSKVSTYTVSPGLQSRCGMLLVLYV